MLAPADKVLHGGNDIMQIIVTRRCDLHSCSNCTQLLPFRRDTPSMSLDVFRRAVDSVADWPGVVALFGGNPCSHPEFEALCHILAEKIPEQRRRGLWSNNLLGHGAVVREVFWPHGRFNLNAHADEEAAEEIDRWLPGKLIEASRRNPAWHGPILMDRKELGVSDEAWIAAREACDINVHWSGAIAERDGEAYGYFCEVAASLDGIRVENHGVLAEPGWWRRNMQDFAGQVAGCCDRGCGVPLKLKGHLDRDDTYDMTPGWAALTSGRKIGKVSTQVHMTLPAEKAAELTDYFRLRTKRSRR